MRILALAAVLAAAAVPAAPAMAQEGDASAGEQVFRRCAACHVVEEPTNRVGPHLVGVIGRPVASVESYNYSNAMKEYGAGGKVWDIEALTAYLKDPRGVVKGTKMAFPGLKQDQQIADVIAYLQQFPGE